MSQSNQKIRRLSDCTVSTSVPEGAVVMSASSELSLRKKKEEARKELYITRI